jgi:hypothetical protein
MRTSKNQLKSLIKEILKNDSLPKQKLVEGRFEKETTELSRQIVSYIKEQMRPGGLLDPEKMKTYTDPKPVGLKIPITSTQLKVPKKYSGSLSKIKVAIRTGADVSRNTMAGSFGNSGLNNANEMNFTVYVRTDFSVKDLNELIPRIKNTLIHEWRHFAQKDDLRPSGYYHKGGYDVKNIDSIKAYFSSWKEIESFVNGMYKEAKVRKVPFTKVMEKFLNDRVADIEQTYDIFDKHSALNRLNYNKEDIQKYFMVDLKNQWLKYARSKYPKAQGIL